MSIENLIYLLPLLASLVASYFFTLKLAHFQSVYLLLGALSLMIAYTFNSSLIVPVIVALVVGEAIHFIAVGALGQGLGTKNHFAILSAVGLYPWHLGFTASAIFVTLSVVTLVIHGHVKQLRAARALGVQHARADQMAKVHSEGLMEDYKAKAGVFFAPAFTVSSILSVVAISL